MRCQACKKGFIQARSVQEYVNALDTGYKWDKKTISYYFVKSTDNLSLRDNYNRKDWNETQKENFRTAIHKWESVCDLVFVQTDDSNADMKLILVDSNNYGYLGHAYFPETHGQGEIYVSYNNANDKDFTVGSYDYITMIHEFGHSIGLAHPHDRGGTSFLFPGVSNWSDLGDNDQNQTVYTVMSYNDLNGTFTPNKVQSWGFVSGPMAYDIKTVQLKYGKKEKNNNTVYELPTNNGIGTYFTCVHDTGGVDTFNASSATEDVNINLNPATLNSNGGKLNRVDGVYGGFTIANGVKIENAVGGSGNDKIVGNKWKNRLTGNEGDDIIHGNGGNDVFVAGPGYDQFYGGKGRDIVVFPGDRNNYIIYKLPRGYMIRGKERYYDLVGDTQLIGIEKVKFRKERKKYLLRKLKPDLISNDTNIGNEKSGTIVGSQGDDFINVGPGNKIIDGNGGDNTVGFLGLKRKYKISRENGFVKFVGRGKFYKRKMGTTYLKNIKYVKFSKRKNRVLLSKIK